MQSSHTYLVLKQFLNEFLFDHCLSHEMEMMKLIPFHAKWLIVIPSTE